MNKNSRSIGPNWPKNAFACFGHLVFRMRLLSLRFSTWISSCVFYRMMHPDKQFRQKTSVISKSSNPQWNTNIRMQLYQPMDESGLQLTIYHRDKLQGSTFLGGVRLNLGPSVERSQSWMDATNAEMELWDAAIASPDSWVDGSIPLRPTM